MKGVEKEFSAEEFAALKDFCKTLVEENKKEHEKTNPHTSNVQNNSLTHQHTPIQQNKSK